jgi:hypothetical protein
MVEEKSSIGVGATADGRNYREPVAPPMTTTIGQNTDSPRKIVLPRRSGEPQFAQPQYYYSASRSGVMLGYDR